jgi:transcriptional regulator with XRE-family HTH domain
VSTANHREQLRHFLKSCRARITPATVGLAQPSRRRAGGLRREDVAALAGVSATYFTWLEQGRDVHPSVGILERLSEVLRLSAPERDYLFNLVQLRPPPLIPPPTEEVSPAVRRMLAGLNYPALLISTRWDIVGWSDAWVRCIADPAERVPRDRNLLRILMTEPEFRRDPADFEAAARRVIAKARLDYSRIAGDPAFDALIRELSEACPIFQRLWHEPAVLGCSEGCFTHMTRVGDLTFEHTSYVVEGAPHLQLLIFIPAGQQSERKYAALLADAPAALSLSPATV